MQVLNSDLDPALKPLATVLALFGNDAGENIFPSVERLAWLQGVTTRTVQRQLGRLRARRILLEQTPLTGGAGRSVHYTLDAAALPARPGFKKGRHPRQGFGEQNHDVGVALSTAGTAKKNPDTPVEKRVTPVTKRVTPASQNPDTSVTRSVSDSLEERQLNSHDEEKTAAAPQSLPPEKPVANLPVIIKIAHEVMDILGETSPDVPETVKWRCAQLKIPYTAAS